MIKHKYAAALLGGLILSGLAGCGSKTTPLSENTAAPPAEVKTVHQPVLSPPEKATDVPITPTPIIPEDETMSETQTSPPSDDESTKNVNLARQDLAQRLGVSVDLIMVNAVIGQEFSAEAFHCQAAKERIAKQESPQTISGLVILLGVSGRHYEYHTSGQTVVFCRPLP